MLRPHPKHQGVRARPAHGAAASVLRCGVRVLSDPGGVPHRPYEQPRLHRLCSAMLLRRCCRHLLTGTNNRDCIDSALPCCQEDVADTCSQGKNGGLPWEEFTIAKAAKKSKLGKYSTIQLGKWVTFNAPAARAMYCLHGPVVRFVDLVLTKTALIRSIWAISGTKSSRVCPPRSGPSAIQASTGLMIG